MRLNVAINLICAALAFVLSIGSSITEASPVLIDVRTQLREEILPLVHAYDENAYVSIQVSASTRPNVKLPGTNVTLEETVAIDPNGMPRVDRIEIVVWTSLSKLPESAENVIKSTSSAYGKNVKIEYRPPLEGYNQGIADDANGKSSLPAEARRSGSGMTAQFEKLNQTMAQFEQRMQLAMTYGAAFLLAMILGLIFVVLQTRKNQAELASGAQKIAAALQSAEGGSFRSTPAEQTPVMRNVGTSNSDDDGKVWRELPESALLALFSDAYWCEQDGYAAYAWRRLPIDRRNSVLQGLPFGRDFVLHFSSLPEEPAAWHEHPYYLNPLPINEIDNDAVGKLVQNQASLLASLPPLRVENLPLQASQILELRTRSSTSKAMPGVPIFSSMKQSPMRVLNAAVEIVSRSDDDDRKLMSLTEVQPAEMSCIVSLVWALRLSDVQLTEALRLVSAQELAAAWIAPQEILQAFERALPERKAKIVKGYVAKTKPARGSAGYRKLHQILVRAVEQKDETSTAEATQSEHSAA